MSFDLFAHPAEASTERQTLHAPDGDVFLFPQLFSRDEADQYFQDLTHNIQWEQKVIQVYGKDFPVPRLSAWYGDAGKTYSYSNLQLEAMPWTPALLAIKKTVEDASGETFNSVLLNCYRTSQDSVAWHSDDEPELGKFPAIGSVSFGQERTFQLKHKRNESLKHSIVLPHGSLLVMRGATQENWLHQVPKTTKPMQPRINLTFRTICR